MIDDLEANKNDSSSYKALEHKGKPNGIQLDVTAISQCAWDINMSVFEEFKIPKFLKHAWKILKRITLINEINDHKINMNFYFLN